MSDLTIFDGKAFSKKIALRVRKQVEELRADHNLHPALAVVVVGNNQASQVYVRNKIKMCEECGIRSIEYRRDADISEQELLTLVYSLNENSEVHGILVQLPLPKHISEETVIAAISPDKDVDGFNIINSGLLATGSDEAIIPCTPLGCLMMLEDYFQGDLAGKNAVIIGRSNIVGKPMASLLLMRDCTVTVAHSKTQNIKEVCNKADILIAAAGCAHLVKKEWVKSGAVVIDVGINHIEQEDGSQKLVGDVDFEDVKEIAGAISPVPGGVGPMTIACLMSNTITAACPLHKIDIPEVD